MICKLYVNSIVSRQMVNFIDSNSVYIKNLFVRHLYKMNGITKRTRTHITSKCELDVRMVFDEVGIGVAEEYNRKPAKQLSDAWLVLVSS